MTSFLQFQRDSHQKCEQCKLQSRLDLHSMPHTNTVADSKYFNFFERLPGLSPYWLSDTGSCFQAEPAWPGFVDKIQRMSRPGADTSVCGCRAST